MTARITVVGSVNIDRRVRVPHIPAPGETLIASAPSQRDLGGKGANQAVAAARMNADATFIAAVGGDDGGRWVRDRLEAEDLELRLTEVGDAATGEALILISDNGENSIIVDPGANTRLTSDSAGSDLVTGADALLLQLEIDLDAAADFAAAAAAADVRVVMNAAPMPGRWSPALERLLLSTDVLILNEIEANQLRQLRPRSDGGDPVDHLFTLGPSTIVVTRGSRGVDAYTPTGRTHVDAWPVPVIDTTGAGDACAAGITVALADGADLATALALGNAAGAVAVQRAGTAAAFGTRSEIDAVLQTTH